MLRLLAIGQRFIDPLIIFIELVFQTIGFAELGESQSKSRIGLDRFVERCDGQVEILRLVIALRIAKGLEI